MQKYTINLYIDDLKPTVYYLTLTNVVIASLLSLLLMLGWGMYLDSQEQAKIQRLSIVEDQVDAAQTNLEQLQEALVKHNDKATFNNQKEMLEKNLEAKEMLWEGVGKQITTSTVDYFLVMKELTEHHDHNLWLSDFRFNEDQAVFSGYALDSSSVTLWMTYLQATQSFQGREFSYINVKAVNANMLSFQVATDPSLVISEGATPNE